MLTTKIVSVCAWWMNQSHVSCLVARVTLFGLTGNRKMLKGNRDLVSCSNPLNKVGAFQELGVDLYIPHLKKTGGKSK